MATGEAGSLQTVAAQEPPCKKVRSTEGRDEAKAASTMTSEEWKQHQVGMNEKWPQPEYMKANAGAHPEGKSHTSYRDETYVIVTRWMEETKIIYRPHAKAPGTKSHVRYEEYSKTETVGESLKAGTLPSDWCWDYERGFIQVIGPVRDEPIDMSKVNDESKLSAVDMIIYRWYRRELAKKLGLTYEELAVGKGCGESTIMRAHRLVAQREAVKRLEAAASEGRRITDQEVYKTLNEWAFNRNDSRVNVMREGQNWVWSDTVGLLRDRVGDIHLTPATPKYPAVVRLINQWIRDRLPAEVKGFHWTSLNLNCNYAASQHRDGNNFGPSCIKAFGDFTGGELNYWPEDDKSTDLEGLPKTTTTQFQLRDGMAMFNGNSAHSVEDFKGERYSVVYFTLGCHAKMSEEVRKQLEDLGFQVPATDAVRTALLRAPYGYDVTSKTYLKNVEAAKGSTVPEMRFWASKDLEAAPFVPSKMPALPAPLDKKGGVRTKEIVWEAHADSGKAHAEEEEEEQAPAKKTTKATLPKAAASPKKAPAPKGKLAKAQIAKKKAAKEQPVNEDALAEKAADAMTTPQTAQQAEPTADAKATEQIAPTTGLRGIAIKLSERKGNTKEPAQVEAAKTKAAPKAEAKVKAKRKQEAAVDNSQAALLRVKARYGQEVEAALRTELEAEKKSDLRKRAVAAGADQESLDRADDADDTKTALVELILLISKAQGAQASAQEATAAASKAAAAAPAKTAKAAKAAEPPAAKVAEPIPAKEAPAQSSQAAQGKAKAARGRAAKRAAPAGLPDDSTPEKTARLEKEPQSQVKENDVTKTGGNQIDLAEATLLEADKLGLRQALWSLAQRKEVQDKGLTGEKLLEVLKKQQTGS